jgi:hypothetical protein
MRPFLVRFSELAWSGHAPSWADFITITRELEFSVHTGLPAFAERDGIGKSNPCNALAIYFQQPSMKSMT